MSEGEAQRGDSLWPKDRHVSADEGCVCLHTDRVRVCLCVHADLVVCCFCSFHVADQKISLPTKMKTWWGVIWDYFLLRMHWWHRERRACDLLNGSASFCWTHLTASPSLSCVRCSLSCSCFFFFWTPDRCLPRILSERSFRLTSCCNSDRDCKEDTWTNILMSPVIMSLHWVSHEQPGWWVKINIE